MKTLVFVPVFNQARELPGVLADLTAHARPDVSVLLVNNGSSDGSETMCRSSGWPMLEISKNLGIGYSFMLAMQWALDRDFDIFCSMASNGKMLAGELPRLLEPILSNRADYVTGSRYLPGGDSPNLPTFRNISIPLVNWYVWLLTGAKLTDATCGYRALRLEMMRRAQFNWRARWLYTYGFEYYLYAKVILDRKLRWCEVPITMRYPAGAGKYSKIRPGIDWWAMLKPWFKARLQRTGFGPATGKNCPPSAAPLTLSNSG